MLLKLFRPTCVFLLRLSTSLLLLLLIVFGIPPLVLGLFLLRTLVRITAHMIYGKSLGKLLTTRGVCSAQDNLYKKPQNNIVLKTTFDGRIELEELRNLVKRKWLGAYVKGAIEKYPELKQHLHSFLGYYFWKPCPNFDLQEQVKELIIPLEYSDKLNEICNEIVQSSVIQAWKKESPLWEINLVNINNRKENVTGSVLILVFHHSLADGYSIFNLVKNELCDHLEPTIEIPLNLPKVGFAKMVLQYASCLFKIAWEASNVLGYRFSLSAWRPDLTSQTWNVLCPSIPIEKFRSLKSHFKVSFSSIIFAVVSKSIKNTFLKDKGANDSLKVSNLLCLVPVTIPGRTFKLRNFM